MPIISDDAAVLKFHLHAIDDPEQFELVLEDVFMLVVDTGWIRRTVLG